VDRFRFRASELLCLGPESIELLKSPAVVCRGALKGFLPELFGESMLARDGKAHLRLRSACNTSFSQQGLIQTGIAERMAKAMRARISSFAEPREIPILKETHDLALDIILQNVGIEVERLAIWRKYYGDVEAALYSLPIRLPGFPMYHGMHALQWLNEQLKELVDAARVAPKSENLLTSLINARDEEGSPLTDKELVENTRIIIFAGHVTIGFIMSWIIIRLAMQPALWESVVQEAGKSYYQVPASKEEMKKFPFAEAIVRETLRYYAPSMFSHRLTRDWITFCGRKIPPETIICVSPTALARTPAFFPEPERFDPSRWLGHSAGYSPFELIPFSSGPRFCLAYNHAWIELVQFLVALAAVMSPKGLRPQLVNNAPTEPKYFPFLSPNPKTKIKFAA
jgi:cytochrome P450